MIKEFYTNEVFIRFLKKEVGNYKIEIILEKNLYNTYHIVYLPHLFSNTCLIQNKMNCLNLNRTKTFPLFPRNTRRQFYARQRKNTSLLEQTQFNSFTGFCFLVADGRPRLLQELLLSSASQSLGALYSLGKQRISIAQHQQCLVLTLLVSNVRYSLLYSFSVYNKGLFTSL